MNYIYEYFDPYRTTHPLGNPQGPPFSSLSSSSRGLFTVVSGLAGSLLAATEESTATAEVATGSEVEGFSGVGVASQFQCFFMYSAKSLPWDLATPSSRAVGWREPSPAEKVPAP